MQRERVAGLGALDVERAGLRVDLGHVEHLGRPVRRAPQPTGERVLGPQPQHGAGRDPVRRRGAAEGPRVLARARAGTPRRPHRDRRGAINGATTSPAAPRNPARAHRRSPVHRAEPVHGDPAVCTSAGASRRPGRNDRVACSRVGAPCCRDRRADQRHRSAAGPPAPAAAALVRPHVPALGRRPRGGGRHSCRRASGRTSSTAAPTSGWSRSGWSAPGSRAARPRRGPARSWRPTCGSTRSTRRGGAASSSSASTPTGPSRSPAPAPSSGCPTAGPGCGFAADGADAELRPRRLRWPRVPGRPAASRSGWAARAPDGPARRLPHRPLGPARARSGRTRYVPNAHAPWPLRDAEVLELDDGLVAVGRAGRPRARRPPDHVVFSEGVAATFGRPVPATRPRPGTVGGPS